MAIEDHTFCPVHDSIELLQEKWVLHIVRALLDGPRGFNELSRAVGGVNTTTLSARLERLEREGVVSKTVESTMPPRTRYELTEGGVALQGVIDAIGDWAHTHLKRCTNAAAHEPSLGSPRAPAEGAPAASPATGTAAR
ncbi:MAG: helix-turn-helix transcriptional regulator [Trueperaceae bacterium]|nr:helix-turn-helix transcriptional regulator [Trueperaceae bacterium]